jgi:hypothetical protein
MAALGASAEVPPVGFAAYGHGSKSQQLWARLLRWVRPPVQPDRPAISPAAANETTEPTASEWKHATLIGFDIVGFGRRGERAQQHVRKAMYELLPKAFADAQVPWPVREWRDDRGDGVVLAVRDVELTADRVLEPVVQHVYAHLRRHNEMSAPEAQINLRMALHTGYVDRDDNGTSGKAKLQLCRMLEAPAFKEAVAVHCAVLGVVISQEVYDNVVPLGRGVIDRDNYTALWLEHKEAAMQGWLYVLPVRSAGEH